MRTSVFHCLISNPAELDGVVAGIRDPCLHRRVAIWIPDLKCTVLIKILVISRAFSE